MKKITQITAIAAIALVLASCGAQKKEGNAS
jgi:PBP1b-binding outer membrane lipoprotein LpoB